MKDEFEPFLMITDDNKLVVVGSPRLIVVGVTEVEDQYHFTVELDLRNLE